MSTPTAKQTADMRLAPLLKIAAGTGKGTQHIVKFEDAEAEFGLTVEQTRQALPAHMKAKLDDITGTPQGTFSGRTAAETRAFALDRKLPAGTSIYAHKVGDHWCVIKATAQGRAILEG